MGGGSIPLVLSRSYDLVSPVLHQDSCPKLFLDFPGLGQVVKSKSPKGT